MTSQSTHTVYKFIAINLEVTPRRYYESTKYLRKYAENKQKIVTSNRGTLRLTIIEKLVLLSHDTKKITRFGKKFYPYF